jgi:hypothetical protein
VRLARRPPQRTEGTDYISKPNAFGNTPLHEAAIMGQEHILRFLVAKGAPIDAVNKRGSTPLLFAIYSERPRLSAVSYLVDSGANFRTTDEDGIGVLHISAIKVRCHQRARPSPHVHTIGAILFFLFLLTDLLGWLSVLFPSERELYGVYLSVSP